MASLLANEHNHYTRKHIALRHSYKQKKEKNLRSSPSVPYDILFSNKYLRDLGRIWELREIVPDPNNMPWIEKIDK